MLAHGRATYACSAWLCIFPVAVVVPAAPIKMRLDMSSSLFKCGSFEVPSGLIEVDVSSLAIPFDPVAIVANLRSPVASSERIQSFVTGPISRDSFHVLFSAPIPTDGYRLDWSAWAETVAPERGDTLSVDYNDLFRKVKRYLGYGASSSEITDDEREEIDDAVQAGVRQFYYPPFVNGVDASHEWSFLRGEAHVSISAGSSSVMLPDGFGRICGSVRLAGFQNCAPIPVVPDSFVSSRLSSSPESGTPRICAVRATGSFGSCGQRRELLVWPTPNVDCEIVFEQESDTGRLDPENRPFPLGGARFSELITESCLSIAEQRSNDEASVHTRLFRELLASAVEQDKKSSASVYGPLSVGCHKEDLSARLSGW